MKHEGLKTSRHDISWWAKSREMTLILGAMFLFLVSCTSPTSGHHHDDGSWTYREMCKDAHLLKCDHYGHKYESVCYLRVEQYWHKSKIAAVSIVNIQGSANTRGPGSEIGKVKSCVLLPAAGRRMHFHIIFTEPGPCGLAGPYTEHG